MRIGIDAYPLYADQNTGIGMVILTVLEHLAKSDRANEYFLYTPAIRHHDWAHEILKNRKFRIVEIKGLFPNTRRLWLQSPQLISRMVNDRIDLFWGGGEYIPVMTPRSITVITTIHDVVFKLIPSTISFANMIFCRTLLPLCLKRSDRCLTVSHTSKKEIADLLYYDEQRIDVIYNSIDCAKFAPGKNQKKKHLLFVGTLQPRKNLVNVLKAYVMIAGKVETPLVIIGASGWKQSEMKIYIESIPQSILKKIIFKGYTGSRELVRCYQEAVALVAPSFHEGFGLCIGEAMASRTAVITSRRGAIPEVFKDAPVYVDPESVDEISYAMLIMINDAKTRRFHEKKGFSLIKNYDIKGIGKNFRNYFEKSVKGSNAIPHP
jgi:glycosyltransferase involved in cell wall biosynthesis